MELGTRAIELLWLGALVAPPLTLVAGGVCMIGRCRPATKHALWAAALMSFIMPAVAGAVWRTDWFRTSRFAMAVDEFRAGLKPGEGEEVVDVADAALAEESLAMESKALNEAPSLMEVIAAPVASQSNDACPEEKLARLPVNVPSGAATSAISDSCNVSASGSTKECASGRSAPACDSVVRSEPIGPAPEREALAVSTVASQPIAETLEVPTNVNVIDRVESGPSIVCDDAAHMRVLDAIDPESFDEPIPTDEPKPETSDEPAPADSTPVDEAEALIVVSPWVSQALVVRDAIAAMPPLPANIWWGGAGFAMLVMALRSLTLYRVVRRGTTASDETCRAVERAAKEIGLSRLPETVMVEERVSPMIWCGSRPKLVLPTELWGELDEPSQRAVIFHELAHLKRRDHWLCWIEALVRVLFWWHPIAWWVCRRVREEADASCDAWVTSLMPRCRRAYAEALIATKSYLNVPGRRVPVGLGVMSNRTKRLARRLTMVMTQKARPRVSALGTCLALGVIAAGMFVMPGLACPPEEQAKAAKPAKTRTAKVLAATGQGGGLSGLTVVGSASEDECKAKCEADAAACAPAGSVNLLGAAGGAPEVAFFGEAPALEAMMNGGDEAALRRLEERLRRLEEQLRRLEGQRGSRGGATAPAPSQNSPFSVAVAPRATGHAGVHEHAQALHEHVMKATEEARSSASRDAIVRAIEPLKAYAVTVPDHGAKVAEGVARELYALSGTAPAKAFYSASGDPFVIVTDGATHTEEYRLPEGKLKAMIGLMEREDVPVLIERHSDKIVVHGTDSQHRVFRAFVTLINPESKDAVGRAAGMTGAPGAARALAAPRAAQNAKRDEIRAKSEQLKSQRKDMERRAKEVEKKADKAREKADKLRSQAESAHDKAEDMIQRAEDESNEAKKATLRAEADRLMSRAKTLEAEADNMERESQAIEAEANSLEKVAADLEAAMDDMEEALDEVEADEADDEVGAIFVPTPSATPAPMIAALTPAVPIGAPTTSAPAVMPAMPLPPTPGAPVALPATPAPSAPAAAPTQPVPPTPAVAPATPAPSSSRRP